MPELVGARRVREVAAPAQLGRGILPEVGAGRSVGEYGILRGFSNVEIGGRWVLRGSPEVGKENIQPESSGSSRRRRKKRGSPLPAWYPRTPLRDITVIINVLERRRIRQREIVQKRKEDVARSPTNESPDALIQQELIVAEDTSVSQHSPSVVSEIRPCDKEFSLPPESISPPSPTVCKPLSCADAETEKLAESERKLSRSIDEIEKRLGRSKNTAKGNMNMSRRSTLMLMR